MRPAIYVFLLIGLTLGVQRVSCATEQCHIHAPADYPSFGGKPLVIPSVGDRNTCETMNTQRFSGRGRCHCVDGFTTPLNPSPGGRPSNTRPGPESLP